MEFIKRNKNVFVQIKELEEKRIDFYLIDTMEEAENQIYILKELEKRYKLVRLTKKKAKCGYHIGNIKWIIDNKIKPNILNVI